MDETIKWSKLTTAQRDELIDEKVMGTTDGVCSGELQLVKNEHSLHTHYVCTQCGAQITVTRDFDKGWQPKTHVRKIPSYSTDMNAAWQVVDLEKFDSVDVKRCWFGSKKNLPDNYVCYINEDVWVEAETAQDAICLAALTACGVEVEP